VLGHRAQRRSSLPVALAARGAEGADATSTVEEPRGGRWRTASPGRHRRPCPRPTGAAIRPRAILVGGLGLQIREMEMYGWFESGMEGRIPSLTLPCTEVRGYIC